MFFTFPENARWDAERQAVEFGVEIGEYQGVVRVPAARIPTPIGGGADTPALCRSVLPAADALREHRPNRAFTAAPVCARQRAPRRMLAGGPKGRTH